MTHAALLLVGIASELMRAVHAAAATVDCKSKARRASEPSLSRTREPTHVSMSSIFGRLKRLSASTQEPTNVVYANCHGVSVSSPAVLEQVGDPFARQLVGQKQG